MGKIVDGATLLLYPLIVFFGLSYLGIRWTALILLVLAGRRFVVSMLKNRSTSHLVLIQATSMTVIIGTAAAIESEFALRVTPFAISLPFIAMFATSLKSTPIIERFARLQKPDLPKEQVAYCRTLTKVWVGVLSTNSVFLFVASMCKDKATWTILVGPVSYGMLGSMFMIEYIYRKRRFQEFDDNLLDRLLKKLVGRKEPI